MEGVVQEKTLLRGKQETSAFIDPDSYQIAEHAITKFVQLTPAPNGTVVFNVFTTYTTIKSWL